MQQQFDFKEILKNQLKEQMKTNGLWQLVAANVLVFFAMKLVMGVLMLFNITPQEVIHAVAVPASLTTLLQRPWTILTYMWMHAGFLHLTVNMICLLWFGQILLRSYSFRRLLCLYLLSGVVGAAFYVMAYNFFPYFATVLPNSEMLGASGAVFAIMTAAAIAQSQHRIRLLFLGDVPIIYVVVGMILINLLGDFSRNPGGEFCHLGGVLTGALYALCFKHGFDFLKPLTKERKPRPKKAQKDEEPQQTQFHYAKSTINTEEEAEEVATETYDIDEILAKLRRSGPTALTDEEKAIVYSNKRKS